MIMITSGSGGAGKTTFAVNLACTYASVGAKTLLLDLNTGLRSADLYLGLQDRIVFDLGDVISGVCSVDRAIVSCDVCPDLSFLCSTQGREIRGVTAEHMKLLCIKLKSMYDMIVVDTAAGTGGMAELCAGCCDCSLTVITPDYSSVRNGDSVSGRLKAIGPEKQFFAINRVRPAFCDGSLFPGPDYFSRVFDIPLAGIVTEDDNIAVGNNQGSPVALETDSYIARNFADIAAKLLE